MVIHWYSGEHVKVNQVLPKMSVHVRSSRSYHAPYSENVMFLLSLKSTISNLDYKLFGVLDLDI
jgi:hypothetical protein